MKQNLCMLVFLATAALTSAQETQTVSQLDSVFIDSKIQRPRKESGKVITTISEETLQNSPGVDVATLINEVSGIEINGSRSNAGQNLSYFARGGNSRQVVILVDGVPLTDPSSINNEYDLRLVAASSLSKIEIIKGASSVLYGSGAGTAVISLTTKPESKQPIAATFTSSVGSNSSSETEDKKYKIAEFTNAASIHGTLNKFFYKADFGQRYIDGLSAVAAPEGEEAFDADDYNSFNTRLNLGVHISEDIQISQFVSIDKFKAGFDDFSYVDANNRSVSRQIRTGGNFQWKYKKGVYVFNDSYTWLEREIESSYPAKYDAKNYTLDNYLTYNFSESITALVGLQYVNAKFNSFSIPFGANDFEQQVDEENAKYSSIDPYVNVVYTSKFGLTINAGGRLNNHSDYGTHVVYNLNPSYNFDFGKNTLKVLASYSTAYITPSLFQLYDPIYGNAELEPEENTTIEAGLEFSNESPLRASVVYFRRNENNFVDFVTVNPDLFLYEYQNVGDEFTASGIEVEVATTIAKKLMLTANYTNTTPDDRFSLRIPEHKANVRAAYTFGKATNLGLTFQYVGERDDSFFNSETFENETIALESYNLLGLSFGTNVSKNLEVFASISNLLDSEYEELYRYQTTGRNARIGFRLSL